jgi:hypothetical protein
MVELRKIPASIYIPCLILFLLTSAFLLNAQNANGPNLIAQNNKDDKDSKDKDKDQKTVTTKKTDTSSYLHAAGKARCDKPDPVYSIPVPDRPGHALLLEKRKCSWPEPLVIMGAKAKDGESISFSEKMEGSLHVHGFEVDTMDNGEKLTWQSMGQVAGEKGPATVKGRWSLMRGTGKFKGARGGGTYEGNLDADGVLTLDFEGVYDPAAMGEDKK